jgi:hypothetical protein
MSPMHAAPETDETEAAPKVTPGVSEPQPLAADPAEAAAVADQERDEQTGANATEAFAQDRDELTVENEKSALDFLLAPKPPRWYGVTVDYDTEEGILPLTFVVRGVHGRKLDRLEQAAVSETTGKVDVISAELSIVAEATGHLLDGLGKRIELTSGEFLTVRVPNPDAPGEWLTQRLAAPTEALEARFATQLGLIAGVAAKVRQLSGYDPRKVGDPKRRMTAAAGNS